MDIKLTDDMKKEEKIYKYITIFAMLLFLLTFLDVYINNKSYNDKTVMSMLIIYGMFIIVGLYGWLYSMKYKLEFDNEKVYLKTLFRKMELNICDVKKYTCNRYRKSVFYQFNLFINNRKVLINTRYKDEFEKVLKDNKIEQIIK